MKLSVKQILIAGSLGLVMSLGVLPLRAQDNQNTTTGEIKKSGSETKAAGKSLGKNMKQGRVVRGSKSFGKHMGRAGKHFGRSTKKFFKKVIS
ncbi:MAG: hypothetical protein ACR2H6_06305 [Pyrinomonadaceae bacterium]